MEASAVYRGTAHKPLDATQRPTLSSLEQPIRLTHHVWSEGVGASDVTTCEPRPLMMKASNSRWEGALLTSLSPPSDPRSAVGSGYHVEAKMDDPTKIMLDWTTDSRDLDRIISYLHPRDPFPQTGLVGTHRARFLPPLLRPSLPPCASPAIPPPFRPTGHPSPLPPSLPLQPKSAHVPACARPAPHHAAGHPPRHRHRGGGGRRRGASPRGPIPPVLFAIA